MFNALNRFISRLDGDPPPHHQKNTGGFGFQVLKNTNSALLIEPWFDFIVGINGRVIESPEPWLFAQEVRNCAGGNVLLGLWNAKGQRTREIHVPVPSDTASLGLSLQWTSLSVAANIWHVLDVAGNSPADIAGLLPYSDYILGSPEGALLGESGLGELVEDHIGRPLRLFIYNTDYNVTREVTIQPSRDWGGQGVLGCVLGYGALHRIPAPLNEPVSAPGETMFDGDASVQPAQGSPPMPSPDGSSVFIPAMAASPSIDLLMPQQAAGATPISSIPSRRKKDRHASSNTAFMDDYFKEQEQKSREIDNAPSGRSTPLPPPPKGGPPKATTSTPQDPEAS